MIIQLKTIKGRSKDEVIKQGYFSISFLGTCLLFSGCNKGDAGVNNVQIEDKHKTEVTMQQGEIGVNN